MVRIFRGGVLDERFEGSVVVIGPRPTTMTGLVRGDLFVRDSSVCDVTGMVSGNLLAERTGKAVLHGLVTKAAKAAGGDLEGYGMVQGDVVTEAVPATSTTERSAGERSSARPIAVRLQERVRLLRGQVAEEAVHPDARRQDAERKFPFPDQLRRPALVEVLEQVPGADLVEGNHPEIAPAVLENRRRRFHGLVGFPHVPWAVPGGARALEHEDAGVPRLGPLVDALARLPNLFRDLLEHVLVSGRHLDHLAVPDTPHRDGKARMMRGDGHERVVVLGPE